MSKTIKIDGFSIGNTGIEIEIDNLGLEILSIKGKYASQNKSYSYCKIQNAHNNKSFL